MKADDRKIYTSEQNKKKRLAIVTMGVKLADEQRGYTRFRKLSEMLVDAGFEVDLITSSFQHWDKAQRDTSDPRYQAAPYSVVFIDEPGYRKNLDLKRIRSHSVAARKLRTYFAQHADAYDLIYSEIPPNDVAYACAQAACNAEIPYIADINDLWPEAMRMAVDIPLISDIAFYPFARDARKVYKMLSAAVGTSDEYAARPAQDRDKPYPHITVYVGNDLSVFDEGVESFSGLIEKQPGEIWATYAGTLGASYDLKTLIRASARLKNRLPHLRVKILGDGPDAPLLQELAETEDAPVDFLGYQDYEHMAAYLDRSDILINSLIKSAPQSIVTKIGDYLASGNPIINTGSSPEFRRKVMSDGFGVNVPAEDEDALAHAIQRLSRNSSVRKIMGTKGRAIAEKEFDQSQAYREIVHLIQTLLA